MKKTVALLMACILVMLSLLMSACSSTTHLAPANPVTLTIWHVYGSQTTSPLNDAIYNFNNTIGKEKGIIVKVEMVTDSGKIDDALNAAIDKEPGAQNLPDLFVAYPRMAERFEDGVLLDFTKYFSEKELGEYREDFLSEGYFDGKLLMLPITNIEAPSWELCTQKTIREQNPRRFYKKEDESRDLRMQGKFTRVKNIGLKKQERLYISFRENNRSFYIMSDISMSFFFC